MPGSGSTLLFRWAGGCLFPRKNGMDGLAAAFRPGVIRLDHEIPGAPQAWDPLDSSELDPVVELVLSALRGERA